VPAPDFIENALRRSIEQRLPVGCGLWKDDAMLWGYVTSVDKTTFRVRVMIPHARAEEGRRDRTA
jgi:hypothetical protein